MRPFATFTDDERDELRDRLSDPGIPSPYQDYPLFSQAVAALQVPTWMAEIGARIRRERADGLAGAHVLRNCPVDEVVPELGNDDPVADKYARKKTFVAEAFLEMFARCTGTPLLAYGSRNNGDFFTDVVAIDRYRGMQTGFSDSELVYHNDRTAHSVRADHITLLGMRCPEEELVYTGFVDGRSLLEQLGERDRQVLRRHYFVTPFDVFSRDANSRQIVSEEHPILENEYSFRYLDATTTVAPGSPPEAKDALLAMRNALTRAPK
ncbi:taurine catabolism dioxygenase TauD, partial [Actinomadura sp. HBU206391]|uniref:taurine catabolism dioxygenase TauD n=1 Tax=Actinomadura sp. HBU206391 TaxID=2731692 RepID=UPI0016503502